MRVGLWLLPFLSLTVGCGPKEEPEALAVPLPPRPEQPEAATDVLAVTNGTLSDVPAAFAAATTAGVELGLWPGAFDLSGLSSAARHFQGAQRLRSGAYLAVTGSDRSDLFVVALASRTSSSAARWGTNRSAGAAPPSRDQVVGWLDVGAAAGTTDRHAGGLQDLARAADGRPGATCRPHIQLRNW